MILILTKKETFINIPNIKISILGDFFDLFSKDDGNISARNKISASETVSASKKNVYVGLPFKRDTLHKLVIDLWQLLGKPIVLQTLCLLLVPEDCSKNPVYKKSLHVTSNIFIYLHVHTGAHA